jgi:hypothetical protein
MVLPSSQLAPMMGSGLLSVYGGLVPLGLSAPLWVEAHAHSNLTNDFYSVKGFRLFIHNTTVFPLLQSLFGLTKGKQGAILTVSEYPLECLWTR